MQVVGVARDSKYKTLLETPRPFFYVPIRQNYAGQANLHIRTRQQPETIASAIAREVHDLDPILAPSAVSTMQQNIELSSSPQRIAVMLLSVFGGLALLLAFVGLYATLSYAVSQSGREFGLRMALGATRTDLLRRVLRQGLALTLGGVVLGAAASLGLARLVAGLLYNVSPRDTSSFAAACAIMLIATLAACLVPAWRATHTDPLRALREL